MLHAVILSGVSLIAGLQGVCMGAEKGTTHMIYAGFQDFGIQNCDTLLTLDCNEFFAESNCPLFYADFRKKLDISFDAQVNQNLTEQVFLCKEGTRYNPSAGILIGYDPSADRIFVELTDADGKLQRIVAGENVTLGQWMGIKVSGNAVDGLSKSVITLSITPENGKTAISTVEYSGPVMPRIASRWVIGRGYPGGFPNSLQVRKGAVRNLKISGEGKAHVKGENPIFTDRFTADPACTVIGDRIDAYVGEDCAAPGGWFYMPHWVAYSTKDMKDWECHGVVLKASDFPYANPYGAWAGQVVERNGKFYYYVTLDDTRNGRHAIDIVR